MRARANEVRLLLLGRLLKPVTPFVESEAASPAKQCGRLHVRFDVRRGLGRTPEGPQPRALTPSLRPFGD